MQEPQVFEPTVSEELYARALGWEMLKFARAYGEHDLARHLDTEATSVLGRIQTILDDDTLDAPQCFQRIEAIVDAFHAAGLSTRRHDL